MSQNASELLSPNGKPVIETGHEAESIVVVGGGGHAKVVISILRKLKRYRILGYTDPKNNGVLLGVPYLGPDSALADQTVGSNKMNVVLGVGQIGVGEQRFKLWTRLEATALLLPMIASPSAIVNEEVSGGTGALVMDGAVINTGAKIGVGAIVNTNSTVEHDVVLEDWVHVAPGATISGGAIIGRFSMIGAGATVIEGINIASGCLIGAGLTVVHDLSEAGVYVGTPARRSK